MVKTEAPPLIHLNIQGNRGAIWLEEREISLDQWNRIRTATFAQIRKDEFIPHKLLDLVERFEERTLVQIFGYKTSDGTGLRLGIRLKTKRGTAHRSTESTTQKRKSAERGALTASEALAFFLRIILRDLKHAESKRKAAPARSLKLIPRSVIAEVAMDLLGLCQLSNYPPGPFLIELFRELLNVEGDKHGAARHVDAQEQAAFVIAQDPTVHTRELARMLNVNPSTICRWRRTSEFQGMVQRAARSIERLKSSGCWDEMLASAHAGSATKPTKTRASGSPSSGQRSAQK